MIRENTTLGPNDNVILHKIKNLRELLPIVARLRNNKKSVVWTNGCFDILHAGHIKYLTRAAALGDVLIVGLNNDSSIQRIKGPDRPIFNETDRAFCLAALLFVDYITIFSESSPLPVLEVLRPEIYAKGGDYTIDTINQEERRLVEGYGGRIALLPGVEGVSTSNIIQKINQEEPYMAP